MKKKLILSAFCTCLSISFYSQSDPTIENKLLEINKSIALEPKKASLYIDRAKIETDMKGLKMSEENKQAIFKILADAYKSDFYDYSKAIELEPNNLNFRKLRIEHYKPHYNNLDNNISFDIRKYIIDDYKKIIELNNSDLNSLEQRQQLAVLYGGLANQNLNTNANKIENLKYADLALKEYKKIYAIDKNEKYYNFYNISNMYQILKKHNEAIIYYNESIKNEPNEIKKYELVQNLGDYYIWMSENNIDKTGNYNKAIVQYDKIINAIDTKINDSPKSLELLARRIYVTDNIGQTQYFAKALEFMDRIASIYTENQNVCEADSFVFFNLFYKERSTLNTKCSNDENVKNFIKLREKLESLKDIAKMLGINKKSFIKYYNENRN